MNIRCMIVDDEPLAREGMEVLVREAGFLDLRAVCAGALEANQVLAREEIDLIFLDIQMPRVRGIDFLRGLKDPPLVIITTAYPHFALEGFELNVLDYLVKPIAPERFLKSVNRARDVMGKGQPSVSGAAADDYFFIKTGNGYEKILYGSIFYVEASQNYATIHTAGEKYMTLTPMRALEEQLPAGKFLRIHKSYIVAIGKIQSVAGNEVVLGKERLPVSKSYREELMKMVGGKLIKK